MSWNESKSGVFYLAIQHDDWCLYWSTNDPGSCNCNPTMSEMEVTEENIQEASELISKDMKGAQKLREGRRN